MSVQRRWVIERGIPKFDFIWGDEMIILKSTARQAVKNLSNEIEALREKVERLQRALNVAIEQRDSLYETIRIAEVWDTVTVSEEKRENAEYIDCILTDET